MEIKLVLLVFLLFGIVGCNKKVEKENEGVSFENLDFAPKALIAKEELPEWINADVKYMRVYKGEWKESIIYFTPVLLSSAHASYFYHYENGEHILFADSSDFENFQSTSKNWILIYADEFWQ